MSETPDPWLVPEVDLELLITYRHLNLSYLLPTTEYTGFTAPIKNIYDTMLYHCLGKNDLKTRFFRLQDLSGYLQPGQSTIILSPPGAGATTLLKAVSLSLPMDSGDILFNGMTQDEAHKSGTDLKKALRYVAQQDLHFDTMTVYETIQFAHRVTAKEPSNAYLEHLLDVFSMGEARNTLCSQISGGQRRRLSTMIGLSNPAARLVVFDSYSDGLDSAAVQRITEYLTQWAKANNAHFICALQQPSPSVFNLFDKTIVLKDGQTVFNGPVVDCEAYFEGMGMGTCPADIDLPSYVMHAVSNPKLCLIETHLQRLKEQKKNNQNGKGGKGLVVGSGPKVVNTTLGPMKITTTPIVTAEEMNEFYTASPFSQHNEYVLNQIEAARIKHDLPPTPQMSDNQSQSQSQSQSLATTDDNDQPTQSNQSPLTNNSTTTTNTIHTQTTTTTTTTTTPSSPTPSTATTTADKFLHRTPHVLTPSSTPYFSLGYTASIYTLLVLVLYRQIILNWRNRQLAMYRIIPAIIISVMLAGLYFRLGTESYQQRMAGLMDPLYEYGYNNMIEISLSIAARPIITNQLDLYPTWVYSTAVQIASVPFSLVETFIFVSITYGMMGHSGDALALFCHFFLLRVHGLLLSAVFRFGASFSTNVSQAYATIGPAVSITVFCGGYYIKPNNLKWPMRAIFWISPFGSAFRALTINEFTSPRYDYLIPSPNDLSIMQRAGEVYLELNQLPTDQAWLIYSVLLKNSWRRTNSMTMRSKRMIWN